MDKASLPGISYGEAGKLINRNVCAKCYGPLRRDFHPTAPKPDDWVVFCFRGCLPGGVVKYVSRHFVEEVKARRWAQTSQVVHNLRRLKIMPLPATVNTKPTFREVGKLRKGITVTQNRQGKEVSYPKEVDYWVLDFDPGESEARAVFEREYPDKTSVIDIIVPFDDIDEFWDAWLYCFKGGNMVAKAGVNPEISNGVGTDPDNTIWFQRLYDVKNKKWLIKNWMILDPKGWDAWCGEGPVLKGEAQGYGMVNMQANLDPVSSEPVGPVIYFGSRDKPYHLSPSGTLRVIVKELAPFLGYVTLHTTSKRDIHTISGELAGLALRANQAKMPLHQLPMQLVRRKEKGRKPDGSASVHYNTHVILDPEFSAKMYDWQVAEANKQFLAEAIEVPALESGPVVEVEVDAEDGYFEEIEDGIPKDWGKPGLVRPQNDYQWICEQAGIDREVATAIWRECEKDYSTSYDYVLSAYGVPLGLSEENND